MASFQCLQSSRWIFACGVAGVLAACPARREGASARDAHLEPDASVTVTAADAGDGPGSRDDGGMPRALSDAGPSAKRPLPPRFAILGGACPDDAGNDAVTVFCSASGRVSGVWAMVDTVDDVPPQGIEVIRDEPRRDMAPGRSLVVALEGERLWFRLVTCGACRRVMGWAFVGDLADITDEQLRVVQERIGLPASVPPLRTARAWRDTYRDRPLPPLPDGSVSFDPKH